MSDVAMNFDVRTDGIWIPSEDQEIETETNAISSSVPQEIVTYTNVSVNLNNGERLNSDVHVKKSQHKNSSHLLLSFHLLLFNQLVHQIFSKSDQILYRWIFRLPS